MIQTHSIANQSAYGDTYRGTVAEIDTEALLHNVRHLADIAGSAICVPLKANAYGHDIAICASVLELEDCVFGFAVATLSEGIELRMLGSQKPIWLLEGVSSATDLLLAQHHQFTLFIHHPDQLSWLAQTSAAVDIWLKFDTDMHRLGLACDDAETLINTALNLQNCTLVGILSHYACADEATHTANSQQTKKMQQLQALAHRHLLKSSFANSAALLNASSSDLGDENFIVGDIARPGISSYGISPFTDRSANDLGLKPVMRLLSTIIALRTIGAGESVGYGCSWQAEEPCQIATIGIGYGDGFCRQTPSGMPVAIALGSSDENNNTVSSQSIDDTTITGELVGRISMDMTTIKFPLNADINLGDSCVLLGPLAYNAEQLATNQGTIPYTVTTQLTQRVPRITKNTNQEKL